MGHQAGPQLSLSSLPPLSSNCWKPPMKNWLSQDLKARLFIRSLSVFLCAHRWPRKIGQTCYSLTQHFNPDPSATGH